MKKHKNGLTLIELIAVIVLILILAYVSQFFIPIIKLVFYPPKQTETIYAANTLANYVTEKNPYFWGLRYAKKITMATSTDVRYTDPDNKDILLELNQLNYQFYYYIVDLSPSFKPLEQYFIDKGIKVDGVVPNVVFKYIDANGKELPSPVTAWNLIKQIELNWIVYSGKGNPQNGDGRVIINTAVEINQVE